MIQVQVSLRLEKRMLAFEKWTKYKNGITGVIHSIDLHLHVHH